MANDFAKVKYSLYNSDSFQAESDDDVSENSCSNINSRYISRKIQFCKDTRVELENSPLTKSFEENELASSASQMPLQHFLRENDVVELEAYINSLPPEICQEKLNQLDNNKRAPLHYAARYNLISVAQLLLKKGAKANIVGEDGLTPLHFSARYGCSKVSRQLIECGDYSFEACRKIIALLLEEGAEVNYQDNYGMTPLHYGAIRGNTVATEELLKSVKINTEVKFILLSLIIYMGYSWLKLSYLEICTIKKTRQNASELARKLNETRK